MLQATVCPEEPGQGKPPLDGAGLSHARDSIKEPLPHVALQVIAGVQADHWPSIGWPPEPDPIGQDTMLHRTVCPDDPGQGKPPLLGAGESQTRDSISEPFPQVALQVVTAVQADHCPSTTEK